MNIFSVFPLIIILIVGSHSDSTKLKNNEPDYLSSINTLNSARKDKIINCEYGGFKLYGKVKIVENFPDLKVKVVNSFPDLKVKIVENFPDDCGEWQLVDNFPDLKIQFVENFEDIRVKFVNNFPGEN